ncbi:hypothetical protein CKAH01_15856 [Colletotrichum kahawae]|uniref:Uncharacterized protein n=1 Tax=Colletotrichum kahawae TaxID=34407 RepID=A0AAD9YH43_COLKA|nr:hypothetical protein CKAH01_15856 [Colletotrichum kahawae]
MADRNTSMPILFVRPPQPICYAK